MKLIGVDAGGTWIKAGLFSSDVTLQQDVQVASGASQGVAAYIDSISDAAAQLNSPKVPIGIALPAVFGSDGAVQSMPNVQGIGENMPDVSSLLTERLGITPLTIENDANCAALGEWQLGHGQADTQRRLLHITWGTGIGTGLIVAGLPQYGWEGGHMPLIWDTKSPHACGCGSRQDLEALIAVPHLVAQAQAAVQEPYVPTGVHVADLADSREAAQVILTLAQAGDPLMQHVVRGATRWLARGLAAMAVVAFPDIVTIGGGFAATDWLIAELRQAIADETSGLSRSILKPEIVHRAQLGNNAGMYGAALLAKEQIAKLSKQK